MEQIHLERLELMSRTFFEGEKGEKIILALTGLLFFFLAFIVFPSGLQAEQPHPSEVIKAFNATLLEAMKKADELGYAGRFKLFDPVVKESFALAFMANQSAGRYWKTMKEEQRNLLLKTYIEWTVATYAGRFDGYSGERFEVTSESEPVQGTVTVVSKFIQSSSEVIDFYYQLRRIEGRWRIVDVKISGVSQLALTRAQFTGILKEKGVDALIAMLQEKIKGFSQSKKG